MEQEQFLSGTMRNSIVLNRSDFKIDGDGHSFFEMILSSCEISEEKWDSITGITICLSSYRDVETGE